MPGQDVVIKIDADTMSYIQKIGTLAKKHSEITTETKETAKGWIGMAGAMGTALAIVTKISGAILDANRNLAEMSSKYGSNTKDLSSSLSQFNLSGSQRDALINQVQQKGGTPQASMQQQAAFISKLAAINEKRSHQGLPQITGDQLFQLQSSYAMYGDDLTGEGGSKLISMVDAPYTAGLPSGGYLNPNYDYATAADKTFGGNRRRGTREAAENEIRGNVQELEYSAYDSNRNRADTQRVADAERARRNIEHPITGVAATAADYVTFGWVNEKIREQAADYMYSQRRFSPLPYTAEQQARDHAARLNQRVLTPFGPGN